MPTSIFISNLENIKSGHINLMWLALRPGHLDVGGRRSGSIILWPQISERTFHGHQRYRFFICDQPLPPQIDSCELPGPNWTDGFVMAVYLLFFAEFFRVKWCWAILNKPVNLLERVAPPECYWLQCFFMDLGFSGCRYLRHLFLSICHRWGLVQLYLAWFGGLEWCCSGLQLYAALTGEFIWSCYFLLLCSSYFVAELLFLACFHFVAKWYSEPPDRLIAMLEGFDNFCAQFPEALNKTNPQGWLPLVYTMPLLPCLCYFFSILLIVVHLKF